MTEDDAQQWILQHFGAQAFKRLHVLAGLVSAEAMQQNLIARSTIDAIWARHIVDSAQLILLAEQSHSPESWMDIGTGAGFPGLVVAALRDYPATLVEPRKKRASFLDHAVIELGIADHTTVLCSRIEAVERTVSVISARAVSKISELFAASWHCAQPNTVWVLPKGRQAREEVASACRAWHGVFHVEPSLTDPDSLIVIASKVTRR